MDDKEPNAVSKMPEVDSGTAGVVEKAKAPQQNLPTAAERKKEMLQSAPLVIAVILGPSIIGVGVLAAWAPALGGLAALLALASAVVLPYFRVTNLRTFHILGFAWAAVSAPVVLMSLIVASSVWTWFTAVVILLAGLFVFFQTKRLYMPAFIALFAIEGFYLFNTPKRFLGLCAIGAVLCLLHFANKKIKAFTVIPLAPFVVMGLLGTRAIGFYYSVGDAGSDVKAAWSKRVFDYNAKHGRWAQRVGIQPHFMIPYCGKTFLVGAQFRKYASLVEIDPKKDLYRDIILPGGVSDNVFAPCEGQRIYVGSGNGGRIFELGYDNLKPKRQAVIENAAANLIMHYPGRDLLLVAHYNQPYISLISRKTMQLVGKIDLDKPAVDMALNDQTGDVYFVTKSGQVFVCPSNSMQAHELFQASGMYYYNLAVDSLNNRLFVSSMLSKSVISYDLHTGAIANFFKGRHGMRYMAADSKRHMLYIANYLTGDLIALNATDMSLAWNIKVGKRAANLHLSPNGAFMALVSSWGGYVLDLDKIYLSKVKDKH